MSAFTRTTPAFSRTEKYPHELDVERRNAVRYPVNSTTSCPFVLPVLDDLGSARIKDISMEGVGLLVQKQIESGSVVAVGLSQLNQGVCRTHLVQVMHCTPVNGGCYLLGGTFLTPLTYEEMRGYLF